ncbi:MAG: cell division protein FtsQ/DivIB [Balneolaceae bacterium]
MSKPFFHIAQDVKTAGGFAAVILLLGLAILWGVYTEQQTVLTDVEFRNAEFTDEEALLSAFASPVGLMADSVDYSAIVNGLRSLPSVKDVSLHMGRRGRLTVNVEEREPLALLMEQRTPMYVDGDGVALPALLGKSVDVPLLYGFRAPAAGDTIKAPAFEDVGRFLHDAKQHPFAWATISEVGWNPTDGVFALNYDSSVKLVFGSGNYAQKFSNWEAFNRQVVSHKGFDAFHTIDLRFRDQIVAKEL